MVNQPLNHRTTKNKNPNGQVKRKKFIAEMDFLSKVYELETDRDIFDLYTKWAESYEQDVIKNGYRTPERCASDLANATTHRSLSILDMGCGTGYSGLALQKAGFSNIDGTDINPAI